MTENKRYIIKGTDDFFSHIEDTTFTEDKHEGSIYNIYQVVRRLNEQEEEIQRLKIQLQTDDVCNKCKHKYLVQQNDGYYISKCKKGFDECSKGTIKYCEDFELKGDVE